MAINRFSANANNHSIGLSEFIKVFLECPDLTQATWATICKVEEDNQIMFTYHRIDSQSITFLILQRERRNLTAYTYFRFLYLCFLSMCKTPKIKIENKRY